MYSTNYVNTLIVVSTDCAATTGIIPTKAGTIAAIQYEILSTARYEMTSDDLLVAVEARRKDIKAGTLEEFKRTFFSEPRACLRCSPLVKSYGWGIHSDGKGKIALLGRETSQYEKLVGDRKVAKVAGMRSRRA